jgi:hypothetical protein
MINFIHLCIDLLLMNDVCIIHALVGEREVQPGRHHLSLSWYDINMHSLSFIHDVRWLCNRDIHKAIK